MSDDVQKGSGISNVYSQGSSSLAEARRCAALPKPGVKAVKVHLFNRYSTV